MSEIIHIPPFLTPEKALYGAPCNGCGWCCHSEICLLGQEMFPDAKAPCPAIMYEDGRVRCGFVLAELEAIKQKPEWEPRIHNGLAIGRGCDADDPYDPYERDRLNHQSI